jgi:hypothetical protein
MQTRQTESISSPFGFTLTGYGSQVSSRFLRPGCRTSKHHDQRAPLICYQRINSIFIEHIQSVPLIAARHKMADTVPAQAPAATGTSTGPTTTTAAATAASATGATTSTQPNNPTIGNANTSTTATDPNSENRGLPYYEKLRRDLRDALQKKRLMDKSMVASPLLPSYILSSR